MNTTRLLLPFLLLFGLPASAVETGFSAPVVGVTKPDVLKDLRRVAVSSFSVQIVTRQNSDGAMINFTRELEDPAWMQDYTERLYREFVDELRTGGLEVVPHETLEVLPEYKKMLSMGTPTPWLQETGSPGSKTGYWKSWFVTPKGLFLNLEGEDYEELRKNYKGFSQQPDDTLTFAGRMAQEMKQWNYHDKLVQKALDTATLHVRIFIPIGYVWSSTSSAGPWTHYKSGAMASVRLGERFTRVAVGHKGDIAKIYLTEPVFTKGITTATLLKEKKSMLGEVTKRDVDYALDRAAYETILSQACRETTRAFIARLKP